MWLLRICLHTCKFVFGGYCCFCAQRHAKEKEYAYYSQLAKPELTNANYDIVT